MTAPILSELDGEAMLYETLDDLMRLTIHCETQDFGRPPPLLAALFELLTGRPFERYAGAAISFVQPGRPALALSARLPIVWMRIDTRYGDLACGSGRRIELGTRLGSLPDTLLGELEAGRALLVLDWSHEGRPTFWTSNIRKIAAPYRISPQNIIVLTQNTAPPEPADADEPDIAIINAHSFIPDFWRLFFGPRVRLGEFDAPFGFAALAPPERDHHYVCMNDEATATRANLVSRLVARPEPGFVSFRKDHFRRNMPGSAAFEAELDRVSIAMERGDNSHRVHRFLSQPRNHAIDLPPGATARRDHHFLPVDALRRSALNIVTEQEMAQPDQQRFTEKTLKAIIAGLPFVVFGNQGTIALLREAGFDVLGDFIDHSYDEEPHPAYRFARAYAAVDEALRRPLGFTPAEHERLEAAAAHNETVFRGQLFDAWVLSPVRQIYARHALAPPAPWTLPLGLPAPQPLH